MSGLNYPNVQRSVAVISPKYCVTNPVELTIVRKIPITTWSGGDFRVKDVNGNVIFKVDGKLFSLHERGFLLDADGNPIINFRQKLLTLHKRWVACRGESTDEDENDLLFSIKKSSIIQMKRKLHVYLASNTSEDVWDFEIKEHENSFKIYAGNRNHVIAEMHEIKGFQSFLFGKEKFGVTVHPNVDYAFIVALVVLLAEIKAKNNILGDMALTSVTGGFSN